MKRALLLILLISLMTLPALAQQYTVGDVVVNFTLQNHINEAVSLYDFPNRIVFIVFWSPG